MYIPFNQLSDEARIWIYQASRPLEPRERSAIMQRTREFLEQWTAHGNALQCSADLLYNQFLILAVEESHQGATGCAVDASIHFVRELEQVFQVGLLGRDQVAFRSEETHFLAPLDQLKATIQRGEITVDMLTFDNTITTKKALTDKWLLRAEDSWLGKYFRQ